MPGSYGSFKKLPNCSRLPVGSSLALGVVTMFYFSRSDRCAMVSHHAFCLFILYLKQLGDISTFFGGGGDISISKWKTTHFFPAAASYFLVWIHTNISLANLILTGLGGITNLHYFRPSSPNSQPPHLAAFANITGAAHARLVFASEGPY